MNKLQMIKLVATRTIGRGGLVVKKYSPEILITVGVVGIVFSTVKACKAVTKAEAALDEAKEKLEKINEAKETVALEHYTDTDYKKDLTIVYVQTGVNLIKVYGPSVLLGVASIGCILAAHGIMRQRNLALMAAYKAIETSYSNYRKRVVEEYGEKKDYDFKNGIRQEKITVVENGKEVEKTVDIMDPNTKSIYSKFYDDGCKEWSKDPSYNLQYVTCQQNHANDLLHSRGHIFLNEVYDSLGIPRTKEGAVVGWVLDGEGDDFVDFGIYKGDQNSRDFVNGYERTILLDFNVQGVIYDLI